MAKNRGNAQWGVAQKKLDPAKCRSAGYHLEDLNVQSFVTSFDESEKRIKQAKRLIKQQLEQPIGLPAIAEKLNISYHTLRKQFPRIEGIPMETYYQTKRLEMAKKLLKDPGMAIFQITYTIGFSANSNFTRWFKHNTGLTPTDYRKKLL